MSVKRESHGVCGFYVLIFVGDGGLNSYRDHRPRRLSLVGYGRWNDLPLVGEVLMRDPIQEEVHLHPWEVGVPGGCPCRVLFVFLKCTPLHLTGPYHDTVHFLRVVLPF